MLSSFDPVGDLLVSVSNLIAHSFIGIIVLAACTAVVLNAIEEIFLRRYAQRLTARQWLWRRAQADPELRGDRARSAGVIARLERFLWPDRAVFALPAPQLCAQTDAALENKASLMAFDPLCVRLLGGERSQTDARDVERSVDELQTRLMSGSLVRMHLIALIVGFVLFYLFADFAVANAELEPQQRLQAHVRWEGAGTFGLLVGMIAPAIAGLISRLTKAS